MGCRLSSELVKAVDTYAKSRTAETGVPHTRTDAIRSLLTLALEQVRKSQAVEQARKENLAAARRRDR